MLSERNPLKHTSVGEGAWLEHLWMELVSGSSGIQTPSSVHPCLVPVLDSSHIQSPSSILLYTSTSLLLAKAEDRGI